MTEDANRADVPVDRFTALWQRLRDHRIAQWTIGYVAVAYGIQHAITLTAEAFEWPNAVIRISMMLLALGLPIAIALAWYHGERASRGFSRAEFSILATLLLGVSILFYAFVQPATRTVTAPVPTVQEAGIAAARQASLSPGTAISLVVMPFENLSPDPSQGYFADGMGEEITTALAKIPDLRVVGRESAQVFKGKNATFRDIGRAMNATHLLEGSVRKAGDRLRVATQLVRADTGATVWANSYDRQETDVFAIQEDIARSIAESLHMTLGLKPGEQLVDQRQPDPALHESLLRARNLVRTRRRGETLTQAIALLNGVVARDPNYAAAWSALAFAYQSALIDPALALKPENAGSQAGAYSREIEDAAQRALKLDPNDADAYCALAVVRQSRRDYAGALEKRQKGLAIDPDSPDCLQGLGNLFANLGFTKQALPSREHLLAVEPFVPAFRDVTAHILFADGQTDAAIALLKDTAIGFGGTAEIIAEIYASQGRFREAADELAKIRVNDPQVTKMLQSAVGLLRTAPAAAPPGERPELGLFDWIYLYTGAPDRFMNVYEAQLRMGHPVGGLNGQQWAPAYHQIRQTDRFKKWIRESGIYAYWKAKGWPPQCHPTTGDDFECN